MIGTVFPLSLPGLPGSEPGDDRDDQGKGSDHDDRPKPAAAALATATNTRRAFLRPPPSKLGPQRDGRPAQVLDVTLRPRFVFELCAPRGCHASDHGASGIRLPGLALS